MERFIILSAAAVVAAVFASVPAAASTATVLYSFCTQANCTDGNFPVSTPVLDSAGTAYVTADIGGANNQGAVASIDKHGKFKVLYNFCPKTGCADGANPFGGLVIDTAGNLFGMTYLGGPDNRGVAFELSPAGKKWKYKVIHKFCSAADCTDGGNPIYTALTYQGAASGEAYDGTSPLYGTAQFFGTSTGGVVFTLTPSGKKWKEKVIYNFCSQASCTDGADPRAGVVVDASGNLFGTTSSGGAGENGVVYELEKHGGKFKQSVLYSFCAQANCADGQDPTAPVYLDGKGNLFGTTAIGGANAQGTVFRLTLGKKPKYTVLHSFCSEANCTDGEQPFGDVSITAGADGNLYGTAEAGGDNGRGLLFALTGSKNTFSKAYSFTVSEGCGPRAGLRLGSSGALYGTCASGGLGGGTIYSFTP